MATQSERQEFARRKSTPVPTVPVRELPKFSDFVPIRRPGDRHRWEKMDEALDEWRKSLTQNQSAGVGIGGGSMTVVQTGEGSSVTVAAKGEKGDKGDKGPAGADGQNVFSGALFVNTSTKEVLEIKVRNNIDGDPEYYLSTPETPTSAFYTAVILENTDSPGDFYRVAVVSGIDGDNIITLVPVTAGHGGKLYALNADASLCELFIRNNIDGDPELALTSTLLP